jgi:hypothetical protein
LDAHQAKTDLADWRELSAVVALVVGLRAILVWAMELFSDIEPRLTTNLLKAEQPLPVIGY